jgi:hypothetical protein
MRRPALAMLAAAAIAGLLGTRAALALPEYLWLAHPATRTIAEAVPTPTGFARIAVKPGSYGEWLRHLPLRPDASGVVLHDGRPVTDHGTAAAVIDIDVGRSDLQQCADAVMRLRAEYLYSRRLTDLIGFALFDGERYRFAAYVAGTTPTQAGERIVWRRGRPQGDGHADLRRWLDIVFGFASTRSLARELRPVDIADAAIGDVFIQPGTPGHAVVIVDLAADAPGRRLALLAQGSMPARDMHLLRNTVHPGLGAWFPLSDGRPLTTPGRVFLPDDLKRF